jgi:hypothetical protein
MPLSRIFQAENTQGVKYVNHTKGRTRRPTNGRSLPAAATSSQT